MASFDLKPAEGTPIPLVMSSRANRSRNSSPNWLKSFGGPKFIKRSAAAFAVAVLVLAAGTLLLPALLSSEAAKARIEAVLSSWLDVAVTIKGPQKLAFFPDTRLSLEDVGLESRDGSWRLESPQISARLDFKSLFFGEIAASTFTIQSPEISVKMPVRAETDWPSTLSRTGREIARLFRHRLSIVDGRLLDASGDPRNLLSGIHLDFSAGPGGANALLRGRFSAFEQDFDIRLAAGDLAVLAGTAGGKLALSLGSPLLSFNLDGVTLPDDSRVKGTLDVSTGDLRQLLRQFGAGLPPGATLGAAHLSGQGAFALSSLEFDAATLDFDGNTGDGRLSLRPLAARPLLEGTLAFDRLNASAYLENLWMALGADEQSDWRLAQAMETLDLDLRLSSNAVDIGPLTLGRSALAVLLREDDMVVDISEAELQGGMGRARLRLHPDPSRRSLYSADWEVAFRDVGLAGLPLPELSYLPLSGKAAFEMKGHAEGGTLGELRQGFTVSSTIDLEQAVVEGIDLDSEMIKLDSTEKSEITSSNRTAIASGQLTMTMDGGDFGIEKLLLATSAHSVLLKGKLQRSDGMLSLRGRVTAAAPVPPAEGAADVTGSAGEEGAGRADGTVEAREFLPFLVRGSWREPKILPDLGALNPRK